MLLEVVEQAALALLAEDAGAEDVVGHEVPITAHLRAGNRLVRLLLAGQRDGHEARHRGPRALRHGDEDALLELGCNSREALRFLVLAHRFEGCGKIAESAPCLRV